MTSKKTVIFIPDVRNWAFDNLALYLKKILDTDYNLHIIYAIDYNTPGKLIDRFAKFEEIDFIHFFYRGYLKLILEYIALNTIPNHKLEKFLSATTTTSIHDHLFIRNQDEINSYSHIFSYLDNYLPVSKILHDIYSNIPNYPKPWKERMLENTIIDATPNFVDNKKLVISWIGNSNWGNDHFGSNTDSNKGYHSIVKPMLDKIKEEIDIEISIANSAQKKRSKKEVFEILAKTDILIIASKIEGTPLPLIEAIASGCAIISTDVGIVKEILPEIQQEFIIDRNIEAFIKAIKKINSNRDLLRTLKEKNYEAYIKIFGNQKSFKDRWGDFIETSINSTNKDKRVSHRNIILNNLKKDLNKIGFVARIEHFIYSHKQIHNFVKFLLKFKIFNFFVQKLYLLLNKKNTTKIESKINISIMTLGKFITNFFSKKKEAPAPSTKDVFYAHYGEDVVLKYIFKNQESGFYVDVGCYHPSFFSNTKKLYDKGWRGVNIDPNIDTIKLFNIDMPDEINLNFAIATKEGEAEYYKFTEISETGGGSGNSLSMDSKKRYEKQGFKTKTEKVQVVTLENVLKKYAPNRSTSKLGIDLLNIDAEGFDLEVLKSNNWELFRPKIIAIEILVKDIDFDQAMQNETYKFMRSINYKLFSVTLHTCFFYDNKEGVNLSFQE